MSTSIISENCFLVRNLKIRFLSIFFFLLYKIVLVFKYALHCHHGHHAVHYTPMCAQMLSHVWLFATPWTVAQQAPLSVGFLQSRILEWAAISFPRSSRPWNRTWISCIGRQFLYPWATREAPVISPWIPYFVTETLYLSTPFIRVTLSPPACLCLFSVGKSFVFFFNCVFFVWFLLLRSYSICLSLTYFT